MAQKINLRVVAARSSHPRGLQAKHQINTGEQKRGQANASNRSVFFDCAEEWRNALHKLGAVARLVLEAGCARQVATSMVANAGEHRIGSHRDRACEAAGKGAPASWPNTNPPPMTCQWPIWSTGTIAPSSLRHQATRKFSVGYSSLLNGSRSGSGWFSYH